MSMAVAADPLSAICHALKEVVAAWRGITAGQIGLATLLGAAFLAQVLVRAVNQSQVLVEAINALLGAFALLLAVVVADRVVDRGASRMLAYGAAVVVGAAAGVVAQKLHMHYVWDAFNNPGAIRAQLLAENPRYVPMVSIGLGLEWLLIDGLATYVYADHRDARKMVARLHEAEMRRNEQARRLLESQLQAMQARVEPRFLFGTLMHIRRRYALDPALAERVLDDLIIYLRAAMPRMRDMSSTLAREIDLARAWLGIVGARRAEPLVFETTLSEGSGAVRMPPMILLPLIERAFLGDIERRPSAAATIHLATHVANGRLRVTVAAGGAGLPHGTGEDAIAEIRERLATLYDGNAGLVLRRRDRFTAEAVIDLPAVGEDGADR